MPDCYLALEFTFFDSDNNITTGQTYHDIIFVCDTFKTTFPKLFDDIKLITSDSENQYEMIIEHLDCSLTEEMNVKLFEVLHGSVTPAKLAKAA